MKSIVLSIFIGLFTSIFGSSIVGEVEFFKGNVKIKNEDSIKKSRVTTGLVINSGDLIISSKASSVKIKLKDGSSLVLDELSTLHFSSLYSAEQLKGKILYSITSRDAKHSLKIKTPFAVIGIKGTTFIVNATENASISLKEGLIAITSLKTEFKLYRKKLDDEFTAFKAAQDGAIQKEKDAFKKFKNSEYRQYDKPVITKEFDLKAGNKISFNGQKVKEDAFNENDNSAFDYFEKLINTMKQK